MLTLWSPQTWAAHRGCPASAGGGGGLREISQPILALSCLSPGWAPQAQLKARLEITQQQATQAKTQLQELQQQSSQIQVGGLPMAAPPHPHTVLWTATRWPLDM